MTLANGEHQLSNQSIAPTSKHPLRNKLKAVWVSNTLDMTLLIYHQNKQMNCKIGFHIDWFLTAVILDVKAAPQSIALLLSALVYCLIILNMYSNLLIKYYQDCSAFHCEASMLLSHFYTPITAVFGHQSLPAVPTTYASHPGEWPSAHFFFLLNTHE